MNKSLHELTSEEYYLLLSSGMFFELYPDATGIYTIDYNESLHIYNYHSNDN